MFTSASAFGIVHFFFTMKSNKIFHGLMLVRIILLFPFKSCFIVFLPMFTSLMGCSSNNMVVCIREQQNSNKYKD